MKRQKAKVHDRRRNQKRWKRTVARRQAAKQHAPAPAPQHDPIHLNIPPRAKLSETILDYAEPLLADAQNELEMRASVNAAIRIWNLSMMPEHKARATLASQIDEAFGADSEEKRDSLELFEEMYRRKQDLFADDNRVVTAHEFNKTGEGSYHLNVMAVFSAPGPEPSIEDRR